MYFINLDLKLWFFYVQGYWVLQVFDEDLYIEIVGGVVLFICLFLDFQEECLYSYSVVLDYIYCVGSFEFNFVVDGFFIWLDNFFIMVNVMEFLSGVVIVIKCNGDGVIVVGVNFEANFVFGFKWMF